MLLYQGRNLELPMGEHKNETRGVGHEGRNRRARVNSPSPRISEVLIMWKPFVSLKCMLNLTECATPFWLRPYVTCSHFLLKEYLSDSWL